jgi:hypothetical protein
MPQDSDVPWLAFFPAIEGKAGPVNIPQITANAEAAKP